MNQELLQTISQLAKQFSSGRFILTVVAAGIFAYVSCNVIIEPKDTIMLLGIIITSYFTKSPTNPTQNTPKP